MLWTPAQRGAELIAWLDADPAYVTLVTGAVAAWTERSGSGRDFEQTTVPDRLGYSASDPAYGGLPVLLGNGAGYLIGRASWATAQPITLYFVGETGANADYKTAWDGSSTSAQRLTLRADPSEQATIYAGSAGVTSAASFATPSIVCAVFNGALSALYVRSTTASVTGNPGTEGIATPIIGRAAIPGAAYLLPTGGKIQTIVVIQGADDATKRRRMFEYLSGKTGLAVTGL